MLERMRKRAGLPPLDPPPTDPVDTPTAAVPEGETDIARRMREIVEREAAERGVPVGEPAPGSAAAIAGFDPSAVPISPVGERAIGTPMRVTDQALRAASEALSQIARTIPPGISPFRPVAQLLGSEPIRFQEGTAFGELVRGQDPRETGALFLEELGQKNIIQQIGTQLVFDPLLPLPVVGITRLPGAARALNLPSISNRIVVPSTALREGGRIRLPSANVLPSDVATAFPRIGQQGRVTPSGPPATRLTDLPPRTPSLVREPRAVDVSPRPVTPPPRTVPELLQKGGYRRPIQEVEAELDSIAREMDQITKERGRIAKDIDIYVAETLPETGRVRDAAKIQAMTNHERTLEARLRPLLERRNAIQNDIEEAVLRGQAAFGQEAAAAAATPRRTVGGGGIRPLPREVPSPTIPRVVGAEMTPQGIRPIRQTLPRQVTASAEELEHLKAVANDVIPPDNPAELVKRVSFPEGKPRLSDPPSFAQEVGVAEITRLLPRLARTLAQPIETLRNPRDYAQLIVRNPVVRAILRWTPGLRNPGLFAENSTQKAGLVRAALIDDGRQKIVGLQAHARQFGNQNDLFGRTDEATGLLTQGQFKGLSVNEIAENPSRFGGGVREVVLDPGVPSATRVARIESTGRLSNAQRQWLDAMDGLEKEILDLYKRNGIPISELSLVDVERYAGRIHVARVLPDGSIIERGLAGSGRGRLSGRTGAENQRVFTTIKEAQDEGFVPLSYEESFAIRAQSAYNRVVNKRASEWLQENLPSGVELRAARPGESLQFGERITTAFTDFPGLRVEGTNTGQFLRDLEGMFPGAESSFLRGVNSFNAVQRIFSLAGDASIGAIQFIIMASRHPIRFSGAMTEFGNSLVRSAINPRANRIRRNKFLVDNADIIQDNPGLILSDSGLEFTEALGRGGFLSPEGIYRGTNPVLRTISLLPGKIGGLLRPFQQAFEGAMDDAGVKLLRGLKHLAGNDPLKKRELVDYVNNMRGLSSSARLGLTPNQRLVESAILLAPRYRRAVGALHASVIQGGLKGTLARQAYLSLFAGVVSTYIGLSFALGKAQGKTDEQIRRGIRLGLDPSKKQFLLWKTGTTAFGIGSKITSDIRLLARIATDPGDVTDFTDFNRNIGVRWVRAQLAASPSDAWDLLTGKDYLGEPITRDFTGRPLDTLKSLGKMLRDDATFLWLQALAFEGGDAEERIIKGGADFMGLRAYPFPGPSYDDVAQAMFGKDFDELALPNSKFFSRDQNDVVQEWDRLQTNEQRLKRDEKADKRASDRQKLEQGIELLPNFRKNLEKLRKQSE